MSWRTRATSNSGLIDGLIGNKLIKHPEVERAMRAVDRGNYSRNAAEAYNDNPHGIGWGQTISAPHMHAEALERLRDHLQPGNTVADIGSGSGYLAACMGMMVGPTGRVVGIDIVPELVAWSNDNLKKDHPELLSSGVVTLEVGNAWEMNSDTLFDAIHVGAAAATLPDALVNVLAPGGRMIIPVGEDWQELVQIDKDKEGGVHKTRLMGVRYVPLVQHRAE